MDILRIGVNDGHTKSGCGSGAVGFISESEHTRLVGAEVRRLIEASGHKAINCAVDYANSVGESLSLIMDQANRVDLDWFVSIHFNAGGGEGVEVYTFEGRQYQDALDVCNGISKLGFKNRGIKDGKGLYVIRRTKARSMLIEVCFVDTADANHYLQVGYKTIARAIVEALIGPSQVVVSPSVSTEVTRRYCKAFQVFFNETTQTGNPISEDSFYGTSTQKSLDFFLTYVKQGRKYKYCMEFQKFYNRITQTGSPILADGLYNPSTQAAYNKIISLIIG